MVSLNLSQWQHTVIHKHNFYAYMGHSIDVVLLVQTTESVYMVRFRVRIGVKIRAIWIDRPLDFQPEAITDLFSY